MGNATAQFGGADLGGTGRVDRAADFALILMGDDHSTDPSSPGVLRDISRVAVAAGMAAVVGELSSCRRQWSQASAVLVHASAAAAVAAQSLPRRSGVCVVTDPVDATAPADPVVWRDALAVGASDVFCLPDEEQRLVTELGRSRSPRSRGGRVIAVVPGHGGAGASVLAAAMALHNAATGRRTLLMDIDAYGPGLDLTLGLEQSPGLRWQELTIEAGAVDGASLHAALPHTGEMLSLLTFGRRDRQDIRVDAALSAVAGGRAAGDVIIDCPVTATSFAAIGDVADLVVVVCGATVPGCAGARSRVDLLRGRAPRIVAAVRGPAPAGLTAGQVAQAMDVPLAVRYRSDVRLPARLDCGGLRIGSRDARRLATAAREVLAHCSSARQERR